VQNARHFISAARAGPSALAAHAIINRALTLTDNPDRAEGSPAGTDG